MEYDVASYSGMFSEAYWFREWIPGGAADCFLRSFADNDGELIPSILRLQRARDVRITPEVVPGSETEANITFTASEGTLMTVSCRRSSHTSLHWMYDTVTVKDPEEDIVLRDRRAYPYLAELTGYIKSFGYRTLCSFVKRGVTP